jgi:hypothetical protein
MSIYGLKESSSVYQETLDTLTVLEPFVRQFSGVFTVQNVAGTFMFIARVCENLDRSLKIT